MSTTRDFLSNDLQTLHIFTLEDANVIAGAGASTPTLTLPATDSFTNPIALGATGSLFNGGQAGLTALANGSQINNQTDINTAVTTRWGQGRRLKHIVAKCPTFQQPTCIEEQGAGTNNTATAIGLGRAITCQYADAGEPFMILQSAFQAQEGRTYWIASWWVRGGTTGASGADNEAFMVINGVLNDNQTVASNAVFPNHSGDNLIGNSNDSLQSYNGNTQRYVARDKYTQWYFTQNEGGSSPTTNFASVADLREFFERTVVSDIYIVPTAVAALINAISPLQSNGTTPATVIAADTVEEQQDALDTLKGQIFQNTNSAVCIVEPSAGLNYRLFVDNQTHIEDPNLRNIAIQFVGSGTLTLENANGSNVVEVSTPAFLDINGNNADLITGGGSVVLVEDTVRVSTLNDSQSALTAAKVVYDDLATGTLELISPNVTAIENVTGTDITVILENPLQVPTKVETDGTITFAIPSTATPEPIGMGETWKVFANVADAESNTNELDSGVMGESYQYAAQAGTVIFKRFSATGLTLASHVYDTSKTGNLNTAPLYFGDEIQLAQAGDITEVMSRVIEIDHNTQPN